MSFGVLERELMRKDLFFKFADVWQAKQMKLAKGATKPHVVHAELEHSLLHPNILVTDEVYQDFKNFVHDEQQDDDLQSPFDDSLEILQDVLKQNGFGEAVKDVDDLRDHLRSITEKEFDTNERSIKKRLDLTIRRRFVPGSIINSFALLGDDQFEEAWRLVHDDNAYQTLVAGSQENTFETIKDMVAQGSEATPKQMAGKRASAQKSVVGVPLRIPKMEEVKKVVMTHVEMPDNLKAAIPNGHASKAGELLAEHNHAPYFL